MIPLFLKETRQLWSWWLALWLVAAFALVTEEPRVPGTELVAEGFELIGALSALLAFWLAHARLASEHRGDHLEFLDGLPVSRGGVALAKLAALLAPLVTSWALGVGGRAWAVGDATGLPPENPGEWIWVWGAFYGALVWAFFGLGCLGSWVGGLAWGALFILVLGAALVGEVTGWSFLNLIDGYWLIDGVGTEVVADWRGPALAAAVGCLGVLGGVGAFLGPGELLVKAGSRASAGLRLLAGAGLGCASMLLGLGGLLIALAGLPAVLAATERIDVEGRFHLLHVADDPVGPALAEALPALDADVARLVGSSARLELDVELMGASPTEGGVFTFGKVRMRSEGGRRTLAHELAHAHQHAVSGEAMQRLGDRLRFFLEGHADWVEQQVAGDADEHDIIVTHAAAIRRTGQGRFAQLVESVPYIRQHEEGQIYALGYVFVLSLVDADPTSPTCLLEAFGADAEGFEASAGLAIWYAAAERCGLQLDDVVEDWEARLASASVPPLPQLRAVPAEGRWDLTDAHDTGYALWCRFREDADEEEGHHDARRADEHEGTCPVPDRLLGSPSYDVQVGYDLPSGRTVAYAWRTFSGGG